MMVITRTLFNNDVIINDIIMSLLMTSWVTPGPGDPFSKFTDLIMIIKSVTFVNGSPGVLM